MSIFTHLEDKYGSKELDNVGENASAPGHSGEYVENARICNHSYYCSVEGLPELDYIRSIWRVTSNKMRATNVNMKADISDMLGTRTRPISCLLTSRKVPGMFQMKVVGEDCREKISLMFQIVNELLCDLYNPVRKCLVAFTIKNGPMEIVNMIASWTHPPEELIDFNIISRELKEGGNNYGSKFPGMFLRNQSGSVYAIMSARGRINSAGLKTRGDILERKILIKEAIRRIVDVNWFRTEENRFAGKQFEEHESYRHNRKKLLNVMPCSNKMSKYFNISGLSKTKEKTKCRVTAKGYLSRGIYPSLDFYNKQIRNYIEMYGCNLRSLYDLFNIGDPLDVDDPDL